MGLRFTTKFDGVAPLLDLPHGGRTRVRVSVNAEESPRASRAVRPGCRSDWPRCASWRVAGYRVGLTIAPIMPIPHWREGYGACCGTSRPRSPIYRDVDLTVECITHRFTAGSKDVLLGWYPRTKLEMDEAAAHPQVRQVRLGQVRLSAGHHGRAALLVRKRVGHNASRGSHALLDIAVYGCFWTSSSASPVLRGPSSPTSRHSSTISTAEPENTATGPSAASAGTAMKGMTVEVARDNE